MSWSLFSDLPRGGSGPPATAWSEIAEILVLPDVSGRDVVYTIDHGDPVDRDVAEAWALESERLGYPVIYYSVDHRRLGPVVVDFWASTG